MQQRGNADEKNNKKQDSAYTVGNDDDNDFGFCGAVRKQGVRAGFRSHYGGCRQSAEGAVYAE